MSSNTILVFTVRLQCDVVTLCLQEVSGDRVTKELFCRVCLPGDTTTVICPVAGQSLLSALVKVCERRKLCLAQYAVLHTDSDKVSVGQTCPASRSKFYTDSYANNFTKSL